MVLKDFELITIWAWLNIFPKTPFHPPLQNSV